MEVYHSSLKSMILIGTNLNPVNQGCFVPSFIVIDPEVLQKIFNVFNELLPLSHLETGCGPSFEQAKKGHMYLTILHQKEKAADYQKNCFICSKSQHCNTYYVPVFGGMNQLLHHTYQATACPLWIPGLNLQKVRTDHHHFLNIPLDQPQFLQLPQVNSVSKEMHVYP